MGQDNLRIICPEFMGSSPSPLKEIAMIRKVPGKSSYGRVGRKDS